MAAVRITEPPLETILNWTVSIFTRPVRRGAHAGTTSVASCTSNSVLEGDSGSPPGPRVPTQRRRSVTGTCYTPLEQTCSMEKSSCFRILCTHLDLATTIAVRAVCSRIHALTLTCWSHDRISSDQPVAGHATSAFLTSTTIDRSSLTATEMLRKSRTIQSAPASCSCCRVCVVAKATTTNPAALPALIPEGASSKTMAVASCRSSRRSRPSR